MRLLDERLRGGPVEGRDGGGDRHLQAESPASVLPMETDAVTVEPVMSAFALRATTPSAPWKQAL